MNKETSDIFEILRKEKDPSSNLQDLANELNLSLKVNIVSKFQKNKGNKINNFKKILTKLITFMF